MSRGLSTPVLSYSARPKNKSSSPIIAAVFLLPVALAIAAYILVGQFYPGWPWANAVLIFGLVVALVHPPIVAIYYRHRPKRWYIIVLYLASFGWLAWVLMARFIVFVLIGPGFDMG
jgi:hypothetical protein